MVNGGGGGGGGCHGCGCPEIFQLFVSSKTLVENLLNQNFV